MGQFGGAIDMFGATAMALGAAGCCHILCFLRAGCIQHSLDFGGECSSSGAVYGDTGHPGLPCRPQKQSIGRNKI